MNTLSKRIERVVTMLYSEAQQSKAARQLKIGQPLLSRTLSGDRAPSKTLVKALAKIPEVNERWLLHGIGEPLLYGGTSLPVVSHLPKTATTRWEEVASKTESFSVSENKFSESRFWWRLTASTLKSWGQWGQNNVRAAAGDFLLLETDPGQMKALVNQRRLAITAHPGIEAGEPCWGDLTADMHFTLFKEAEQQKRVEYKERLSTKKPRRGVRNLSASSVKPKAPQKKMSFQRKKETSTKITSDNLRALVIEMTSTSIFQFESNGS